MTEPRGRILVVDDTPANLHLLMNILTAHGYKAHPASTGRLALQFVEALLPDLILLDVVMPGMDGYQVCERLKASERTRDIPVIFVSGMDRTLDKVRGLSSGGVDYVVKPIQAEELLARIETHLSLRRLRAELEARVAERTNELKAALAREQSARAGAEAASRLKDEFLATLSHELRTPLQSILGWATLINGGKLSPTDVRRGMACIQRNAVAQAKLVDDLLDMSRIVTGRLPLSLQVVDLASIVSAAVESVQPAAEAKKLVIEQGASPPAALVKGDPDRLHQMIWNLLTNAVKFTPAGGRVTVSTRSLGSHVEVTIADTGIGIEPDFLPHAFERFRQADSSTTRVYGGLGLGLAIVRHLAELHGGTVRVASEGKNKGATFTLSLPLVDDAVTRREAAADAGSATNPPAPAGGEEPDLEGITVLVVDDEPEALEVIGRLLTERHANVETASSAVEALEQMNRSLPNVLVSDVGMPGEDGYALIRKVRQRPRQRGGSVPAMALTAFAREEDRARLLEAGYQAHLPKPVERAALLAHVASLARHADAPLPAQG